VARLGELLVREQVINVQQLNAATEAQRTSGERIGACLIQQGAIDEKTLVSFLSRQYHVPTIDLADFDIEKEVLDLVGAEVSRKHMIIPVHKAGSSIVIAIGDPSNLMAIDDIKFLTGFNVEMVIAGESQILSSIEKHYESDVSSAYDNVMQDFDESDIEFQMDDEDQGGLNLEKDAEEAPVVRLVNLVLVDAMKKGASDIHIEPYEKEFRVRLRIDGALYEVMRPPLKLKNAVVSRIKIMASLDISERRLPQDGRIKLKLGKGREMDFRVSILPTLFGEKIVMRLLDKSNLQLDMTKLGFTQGALKNFKKGIHQPFGMVLVTGPTGSGKTTTLYSALSDLNKVSENISTAEDPVEFNLAGINQVQMHEGIGLNFAAALRSFLRQDPDIIMVGEIRDFETAEISIKAALTGHLVLSTLHTNDAPSTISRMLNMGIEPFLITAALNVIVAQRLARRICSKCRAEVQVPEEQLLELQVPQQFIGKFQTFEGKGCATCSQTGYKGRVAIYEVLEAKDELKQLILEGAPTSTLKRAAMQQGMISLRQAALQKFMEGLTTAGEVGRVSVADDLG
jgi:type IV pilus assembly protein PilB